MGQRIQKVVRSSMASLAALPRTTVVKVKINGVCVNRCRFCIFHSDRRRLEVRDLDHFFGLFERPNFQSILINGGEPTIHPSFVDICRFLRERFRGRARLVVGSNLIPLGRDSRRYQNALAALCETFDHVEVGCDDEHRNITVAERLIPELLGAGLSVAINVMEDYCSVETRERIISLIGRYGVDVNFSGIHHQYAGRETRRDLSAPCRKRAQHLVLNCNGDAFFCFHQEMETPLFNIFDVSRERFNYFLNEYVPDSYRFCGCCPLYEPESGVGRRAWNLLSGGLRRART
jgi:MoaA/NifB/PqqE/SkfB family radical SAM enzyme